MLPALRAQARSNVLRSRNASTAARSPRLRKSSRSRAAPSQPVVKNYDWPATLLEEAHRTGLISLEPSKAAAFLNRFFALNSGRPTKATAQTLLKEFNADARTLFWLGWLLQRRVSVDASMKPVVKTLHATAAAMQDANASLLLTESAIRAHQPNHPDLQFAEPTLVWIAGEGDMNARERLAALWEARGEQEKALSMAEDALESQRQTKPEPNSILSPQFSAWRTAAKIYQLRNDSAGALRAIEHGAAVMDDPDAYCELATKKLSLTSQQMIEYLLKSAASGVGRAALLAGEYYYQKATGKAQVEMLSGSEDLGRKHSPQISANSRRHQLRLASEWFQVAVLARQGTFDYDRKAAETAAGLARAEADRA